MPLQDIYDVIAAHCDLKTHSKVTGICPSETIRLSTGTRVTLVARVLLFLNQKNMKEEHEDTPCCIFY